MTALLLSQPGLLRRLADREAEERVKLEAVAGARSFRAFMRMAWPHMDPAHLLWNWHNDVICDEMERAARREVLEMTISVPPRTSKSVTILVAFPAWVWTWAPEARFITASYEMQLATRDAVTSRSLVKSAWYQRRWGPGSPYRPKRNKTGTEIDPVQDNKTFFATTAKGYRFLATPGSSVTGWGADFILADDINPPNKVESEAERLSASLWWFETIPTRLNDAAHGVKIIIQQRVHAEDLAGQAIKKGYHPVILPMKFDPKHPFRHPKDPRTEPGELLHPERMPGPAVARLEKALGPYAAAAQLQQLPGPREGGLFKRTKFRIIDALPAGPASRVRAWDLAATAPEPGKDPDWTVGVKMLRFADRSLVIEHVERFRAEPDDMRAAIRAIASQDGPGCPIFLPQEPGAAGKALGKDLVRELSGFPVRLQAQTGDKWTRAQPFAAQVAVGNVALLAAPWNEPFLEELSGFPNASHDDQVDAASGAFLGFFGAGTGLQEYMEELAQQLADEEREAAEDHRAVRDANNHDLSGWG